MNLKIKLIWKQIYKLFFAIVEIAILTWAFVNGILNKNDIINRYHGDYTGHRVSEVQQINSERGWFFIEKKHYFILRSLVIKYGKDNVINMVNNIVINNVKEDE